MNGTVGAILGTMNEVVPYGQRTVVVAGAHTMYLYGPGEREMVTCLGWRTVCQCSPGGASLFTCWYESF